LFTVMREGDSAISYAPRPRPLTGPGQPPT
jgi:hypothetical protein